MSLISERTFRAIYEREYLIMVEDTGRTFNINAHTFSCYALSKEEAIGKMVFARPEFKNRRIESIRRIEIEAEA